MKRRIWIWSPIITIFYQSSKLKKKDNNKLSVEFSACKNIQEKEKKKNVNYQINPYSPRRQSIKPYILASLFSLPLAYISLSLYSFLTHSSHAGKNLPIINLTDNAANLKPSIKSYLSTHKIWYPFDFNIYIYSLNSVLFFTVFLSFSFLDLCFLYILLYTDRRCICVELFFQIKNGFLLLE